MTPQLLFVEILGLLRMVAQVCLSNTKIDFSLDQWYPKSNQYRSLKKGCSLFYIHTNQYESDCPKDPDMKMTVLNI